MTTFKPPAKVKSTDCSETLVISPTLTHKQTFIILHGRGSNAQKFGPPLLSTKLSDGRTFSSAFPHAKLIFPTAFKRLAHVYNRSTIHQWFDIWLLSSPAEREELMIDGMRETSKYIHSLLTEAIEEVGPENVVLGGLSQDCAATLISLLTWEGKPLAAAFGMCGWLPLRQHMTDIVNPQAESGDDEDPFARENEKDREQDLPATTVARLREELELPSTTTSSFVQLLSPETLPFQRTPIFLAHGAEDETVKVELGHDARDCLALLRAEVIWKEYQGLGHWYSVQMLEDLVTFLEGKTGWTGKLVGPAV